MKIYTVREAKSRLGEALREALSGPVVITVHGRPSVRIVAHKEDAAVRHDHTSHQVLDTIKHKISCEVLARFPVQEIRRKSLSNIERWRSKGGFGQAYTDWLEILTGPDDSV